MFGSQELMDFVTKDKDDDTDDNDDDDAEVEDDLSTSMRGGDSPPRARVTSQELEVLLAVELNAEVTTPSGLIRP
jgi:hypothetical protein